MLHISKLLLIYHWNDLFLLSVHTYIGRTNVNKDTEYPYSWLLAKPTVSQLATGWRR